MGERMEREGERESEKKQAAPRNAKQKCHSGSRTRAASGHSGEALESCARNNLRLRETLKQ